MVYLFMAADLGSDIAISKLHLYLACIIPRLDLPFGAPSLVEVSFFCWVRSWFPSFFARKIRFCAGYIDSMLCCDGEITIVAEPPVVAGQIPTPASDMPILAGSIWNPQICVSLNNKKTTTFFGRVRNRWYVIELYIYIVFLAES